MKNLFHRQLYIEGLKKVMIPGIISAIIVLGRSILVPITFLLFESIETPRFLLSYGDFGYQVCGLLVMTPILVYFMFSFLNKRKQSDFYHAIPVKRSCMLTTMLASVYTWVWGILIASVGLSALLWTIVGADISLSAILLTIGMYFVATMYIGGFVILAMSISGTGFSNFVVTCILMFSFRIYGLVFYFGFEEVVPVFDPSYSIFGILDIKYWFPAALFDSFSKTTNLLDPILWIFTLAVIIAVYILAYLAFVKRKSQSAGISAAMRKLQTVYRTLLVLPLFLITFVTFFTKDDGFSTGFVLLMLTLAVYYIYELISTKKIRTTLKATVYLVFPIVSSLCLVGVIYGTAGYVNNRIYTEDEIRSIRLYNYYSNNLVGFDDFETNLYNINTNSYEQVVTDNLLIHDPEAISIVAKSLKLTLEGECMSNAPFAYQYVEITLNSGQTVGRRIRFNENDFAKLQKEISFSDDVMQAYLSLPDKNSLSIDKGYLGGSPQKDLEHIWDLFVEEYQMLSDGEKFKFKQESDRKLFISKTSAPVRLFFSGRTDRHDEFYCEYIIPDSFVKTRQAYAELISPLQDEILEHIKQFSMVTEDEFLKDYERIIHKGTIVCIGNLYEFDLSINPNTYSESEYTSYKVAETKKFLTLLLPYLSKDFDDENYITLYLELKNDDIYISRNYILGLKPMSSEEKRDLIATLRPYLKSHITRK